VAHQHGHDHGGGHHHDHAISASADRGPLTVALALIAGFMVVEVVAGAADRTNFPDGACDALFMRNVYHHFAAPGPMGAALAAALKPGGRLAIVDFRPRGTEASMPEDRDEDATHGVSADSVRRELMDAGFQVERTETRGERAFMVLAVRGT